MSILIQLKFSLFWEILEFEKSCFGADEIYEDSIEYFRVASDLSNKT